MQIVIDFPEADFEQICTYGQGNVYQMLSAISSGTVLPENHGRLIDADELYGDFIDGTEGYDCQTWNRIEIGDIIEDAPTIIEADKAESE